MRASKLIILLCVAYAAYHFWSEHHGRIAGGTAGSVIKASANGFVPLPLGANNPPEKVWVCAPPYCPSKKGQRADELMRLLPNAGIQCARTATVHFAAANEADWDRINSIWMSGGPVVFVNGRAKNNPTIAEIIAEYRQNGGR